MTTPKIVTSNSLTAFVQGKAYTVDATHPGFQDMILALDEDRVEDFLNMVIPTKGIGKVFSDAGFKNVEVTDNSVLIDGSPVANYVVDKILEFSKRNMKIDPMIKFLQRLLKNPSFRVVQQLYRFLECSNLPLTDDGRFLAYKIVTDDYKDPRTKKFDNSVGAKPRIERNKVDEDPNETCSHGLHVCSEGYIGHYRGDRLMLVVVDPVDVVAIPHDYNNSKMRVCGYEVIQELPEMAAKLWDSPVFELSSEDADDADKGDWFWGYTDSDDGDDDDEGDRNDKIDRLASILTDAAGLVKELKN